MQKYKLKNIYRNNNFLKSSNKYIKSIQFIVIVLDY